MTQDSIQTFIDRWSHSGGAERANYQLFLGELCDTLDVPRPDPTVPDDDENAYVFERQVVFINPDGTHSYGRIDLYRRGSFVLETKQGVEKQDEEAVLSAAGEERRRRRRRGHGTRGTSAWNDTLLRARGQAEQYARALVGRESRPPFLVVIDVGHTIELYAEFTQTGGTYIPFPDPQTSRIRLADLADGEIRARPRAVWLDPLALDPSRRSAKVTREIAAKLALLAKSLEAAGHDPEDVAQFLMRCLFTMFAEDVELLPKHGFRELLTTIDDAEHFQPIVEALWQQMNVGGFSVQLHKKLLHFNGGLFYDPSALPVTRDQLDLLIDAAGADWRDVEPAIFGTLLERALDPVERHKLGAHYTPRAYVERLVMPTIIEPIRAEWDAVKAAAILHAQQDNREGAKQELEAFHDRLCDVKVLDPACGTGNFLYVTLEHLKRIEGEVFATYESIAERQMLLESGHTVDPHQLLGIEINPRAAAIADLVLWIGYLQWHYRTRGNVNPPEPVLKNFKNIECRDALLTWSSKEPLLDDKGKPVTRWDGRTTKPHPVTGEEVPDETARVVSYKYNNPKKAEWPKADYVVGNPPFIGGWLIRSANGDGYVDALWSMYDLPEKSDYVMYWWNRAAESVRNGAIRRFGFITTNSVTQVFQRRVITSHLAAAERPLRLVFAIPDHPWVDSSTAAAVRIAMTVGELDRNQSAVLGEISDDSDDLTLSTVPLINDHLSSGVALGTALPLKSNDELCSQGVQLYGSGFIIDLATAERLKASDYSGSTIRRYMNGRDLMGTSRGAFVIDFFGAELAEARIANPAAFQHVNDYVKPERDQNRRESIKTKWWRFGWERPVWRSAVKELSRFIATPETAKHRVFAFLGDDVLPDNMLTCIALDDAFHLGVFSSKHHVVWTLSTGGTLEDRPRYTKITCFDPFPFPAATDSQKSRIRELGEQLDAHRKRQQELHPGLTMTGMYNVLEKLRAAETLTAKEQQIHAEGLVSVLRQIHDELDAAVAEAYGWPADLADEEILARLVALNHERAEEERRGIVRWLRPEFQNPSGAQQTTLVVDEEVAVETKKTAKAKKQSWPKSLSEQAGAVQTVLAGMTGGATAAEVAKVFGRATKPRVQRVEELLETLEALGKARELDDGRYVAV